MSSRIKFIYHAVYVDFLGDAKSPFGSNDSSQKTLTLALAEDLVAFKKVVPSLDLESVLIHEIFYGVANTCHIIYWKDPAFNGSNAYYIASPLRLDGLFDQYQEVKILLSH